MSNKTASNASEVVRRALESRLSDVYTALPGTVQHYYASTQTADIQLVVRRPLMTIDDDVVAEELPILPNVPVLFPRGGGYSVTWPLSPGDGVEVIVQTYAFAQWRQSGQVSDVGDLRLHSLANTVCIPGLAPNASAIPAGQAGADAYVIEGPNIKLGTDATDFVALATKVHDEMRKLQQAIATTTPSPGDGGAQIIAKVLALDTSTPFPASMAATKVKAK